MAADPIGGGRSRNVLLRWLKGRRPMPDSDDAAAPVPDPALAQIAKRIPRLAQQGRWAEILALTSDDRLLRSHFRLLLLRVSAAIERRDAEAAASTVRFCLDNSSPAGLRVAAASRLITAGYADLGWRLIADLDDLAAHPNLPKLLERVASKTRDRKISRLAANRHAAVIARSNAATWTPIAAKDPDAVPPPADPAVTFVARPLPPPAGRFELRIDSSPEIAPNHAGVLRAMMAKFERSIADRPAPALHEYRDVFVSRLGQIWRSDGTIIKSNRPLPPRPSEPVREYDEAAMSANATRGFYHWFAEKLPSLGWRLEPGAPGMPILLASHAAPFEEETLRLLGVRAGETDRIGDVAYCRRLYAAHLSVSDLANWKYFHDLYARLVAAALAEAAAEPSPNRIYVSRRDTTRRVLTNEEELEEALARLGVVAVRFSEHSLARQIAIAHNARLIVGPHGAGLSHIINTKPGGDVLEIVPNQDGFHSQRFNFARLSRIAGHRHTLWLNAINPFNQRWTVDVARIVAMTEGIIAQRDG
jgi:hypothetical protein